VLSGNTGKKKKKKVQGNMENQSKRQKGGLVMGPSAKDHPA